MEQNGWKRDVKRLVLVVAASCAVSYTHLDVYKRQPQHHACIPVIEIH